ncbi:exopolyphosphatase-like enzyme [Desulfocapsa sulfexigens DSM 10523]|uniref:Exopolyphosphatase-like enzyme n=1 Tax=Desulfocapsa sulfexigens (strain DSM 10523 / SB164P1) TaxID=1167006 RepID=M1NIJ0_DESSD|nr:DHH family phosphoesterase [Desulfocapsa sulfexigens]AGF79384.1 exopolyphosphatase-like enzyme [Desulfocapsa sulfexigens DSM 10523]
MLSSAQPNTHKGRYKSLLDIVSTDDIICILIVADPDAIASALALKRLFWRKVQKTLICRVNAIKRSDNLAMLRDLRIDVPYITKVDTSNVTKWAIVDSQPHHHKSLNNTNFSIVIDHHSPDPSLDVPFKDIREEYGAVSSIMTEYLKTAGVTPSTKLATALFYGIKTDTDNFTRTSTSADVRAFRYLYPHANINIIKKIESSEINKKNLVAFRKAFEELQFIGDTAYIHMGVVKDADVLVILADFFLKMAEATWCIVSGIYGKKLIIILRNVGFRRDAGKVAMRLFGEVGSAGGHKSAARVEIPVATLVGETEELSVLREYVADKIRKR